MKSGKEMKRETDSCGGFFFLIEKKKSLLSQAHYESINPHYDTLPFHSFTTCCRSSNGNITVTLFKSHIQYLLFYPPGLERNVNKPRKPRGALTSCRGAAGFYPGFCEATHGKRLKLGPVKSVQANFLFIFVCVAFPE